MIKWINLNIFKCSQEHSHLDLILVPAIWLLYVPLFKLSGIDEKEPQILVTSRFPRQSLSPYAN